jgi:hypothetical protein
LAVLLAVALAALASGRDRDEAAPIAGLDARAAAFGVLSSPRLPAGTEVRVKLAQTLSSKTAYEGMAWTGVVVQDVKAGQRLAIPQGSEVRGEVAAARSARRGERAMLDLVIHSIMVDGRRSTLRAHAEPVVAGSPRARNLGAIAGGVAAGALLGRAIGGNERDAAIGGLIGAAAATGAVAASKGYQVVLEEGTTLEFVVHRAVAMR